jgi:hypothetical protein
MQCRIVQVTTPPLQVLFRQFERVQYRAHDRRHIPMRASKPGLRLDKICHCSQRV